MYAVYVNPKRGNGYFAPSKEKGEFFKLKRDAVKLAEVTSLDDSVFDVEVGEFQIDIFNGDIIYRNGKVVK